MKRKWVLQLISGINFQFEVEKTLSRLSSDCIRIALFRLTVLTKDFVTLRNLNALL